MAKRRIELPKKHLSPTQLSSYLRCPKAYYFSYVENIKIPPPLALVEGGVHHKALKLNNKHKIKEGEDLKAGVIVEAFCDIFSEEKDNIGDWNGEDEKSVILRGKKMLSTYMLNIAPSIDPIKAEEEVVMDIAGVPFLMYPDLVEDSIVSDYKTVGRAKSQRDADNDLQLSIYAIAEGLKRASFIFMTKSIAAKVGRVETKISSQRVFATKQVISSVADAISKGAFPLCDASLIYTCNEDRCGYWPLCKGKKPKRSRK